MKNKPENAPEDVSRFVSCDEIKKSLGITCDCCDLAVFEIKRKSDMKPELFEVIREFFPNYSFLTENLNEELKVKVMFMTICQKTENENVFILTYNEPIVKGYSRMDRVITEKNKDGFNIIKGVYHGDPRYVN